MKIESLRISNFRGIKNVSMTGLSDTIIIAGQNGSGKSCIFDAIRLLKSTYGGYQQNEWQNFFGEFQIQLNSGTNNLQGLFNDPNKSCNISAKFVLRDDERKYITENASELLEETIWQKELPEAFQYGGYRKAMFAAQFRDRQPEVLDKVSKLLPSLYEQLAIGEVQADLEIFQNSKFNLKDSTLLSVVFSNYRPRKIGLIDFHGAQRHYGRENVQGINLSIEQNNQTYLQSTLYNYNAKYSNVKSEMAANFIKELLSEAADGPKTGNEPDSLTETLKSLFNSFFPDKEFLGPQPTADGSLSFPVKTANGSVHDLDELSSGEKEILYGYLRIRSSAPRNSIILLDEPELHLNPRLIRGLPDFYKKNLGLKLKNQIWLVTHSDALIREAIGKPGFNVFHMLPCGHVPAEESQLRSLSITEDLEAAIADLVGDLAAYRPGGKGLVFEGGGDSDFDRRVAATLFAEELQGINLISGSNKARVRVLHEVLDRAYKSGHLPTKFFAVTDKDSEQPIANRTGVNIFSWDVYHIENYLLDSDIIADVASSIDNRKIIDTSLIENLLRQAAFGLIDSLVAHKLRSKIYSKFRRSIDLSCDISASTIVENLRQSAERSVKAIASVMNESFSEEILTSMENAFRGEIESYFSNNTWRKELPGRDILKGMLSSLQLQPSVNYEVFRNLILSKMAERGVKPAGMAEALRKVVDG